MQSRLKGKVIKLDKSFPLVKLDNEKLPVRVEFSSEHSKSKTGVTIGDEVIISKIVPDHNFLSNHIMESPCIIEEVLPRKTELARLDALNRRVLQIMAANFDEVIICESAYHFNISRFARELVIANNSNAKVRVFITKCDLTNDSELLKISKDLQLFNIEHHFIDYGNFPDIDGLFSKERLYVLLGASGVGKSTLINYLCGDKVQKVGNVREKDQKGRHTTVAREIFTTLSGAEVIDMPGVRAVGIKDAEVGFKRTFPQIYEKSRFCKFRNCTHNSEPGCAVLGDVSDKLLSIWHELQLPN